MSPRKCPAEIHPQIGPRPAGRTPSSAVLWGRGVQLAHGSRGAAAKSRRVARGARALTGWPSTPPGCHHARPAPVGPPPSRVVSLPGVSPGRGGSASFEPLDPVSALASVQACVLFPSDSRSSSLRLCQREALCTPQRDPEPSPCFRRGWSSPQGVWPLPSK